MNTIRQITLLQQLALVLAFIGATQSLYGDLVAPYLGQPRLDLLQTGRVASLVSASMAQDRAAIENFVAVIKANSQNSPRNH